MHARALLFIVLCAAACGATSERPTTADGAKPAALHGVDLDAMDRSVRPGDDFFKYANGRGLAETEIPADRAVWGTVAMVSERTDKRVADLIQDAAAHATPGSDARKVGDFYSTY